MQFLLVAFLTSVTIALSPSQAECGAVQNTSFIDRSGSRILEFTTTLHVPADKVWAALTDPNEYKRWGAPSVFIDLHPGGVFEVGYTPGAHPGDDANVKHEIIAFVPTRMIAFRNLHAPIAAAEAYRKLQIVILLTDRGDGKTDVSLADVGFQKGGDFDGLYAFFAEHNPEYLEQLAAYLGQRTTRPGRSDR